MIPSQVVDEIRERVSIREIIGEVVRLKKVGRHFSGLCPFHQEKTPSFTVSEDKQLYYCFGCGEGGTVYTFMMKFHRLSFPEALERLSERAGIDLSQYSKEASELEKTRELKQKAHALLEYAAQKFHDYFLKSAQGKKARDYALSRGFDETVWKKRKLGLAPSGWDTLVEALKRDGHDLELALKVGLVQKRSDGSYFDVFRDRWMFPISDISGKVIAFGGRTLGTEMPKYLNSSETLLFSKRKTLYGLDQAVLSLKSGSVIVVVEGYADQVALNQMGIENAVATLGTALTPDHAKLLKRYCDEAVVVFDGDEAGQKAAVRSMKPLLCGGLHASVAFLPTGQDPDQFVRKEGQAGFLKLVHGREPLLGYFIETFYLRETNLSKKTQSLSFLKEMIQDTHDPNLRESLINEVIKLSKVDRAVLESRAPQRAKMDETKFKSPVRSQQSIPEEWTLLRVVAEIPEAFDHFHSDFVRAVFPQERMEQILNWFDKIERLDQPHISSYVDAWEDEPTRPFLAKAFMNENLNLKEQWSQVWNECLKKMRDRKVSLLSSEIEAAEKKGDDQGVEKLFLEMTELKTWKGLTLS